MVMGNYLPLMQFSLTYSQVQRWISPITIYTLKHRSLPKFYKGKLLMKGCEKSYILLLKRDTYVFVYCEIKENLNKKVNYKRRLIRNHPKQEWML